MRFILILLFLLFLAPMAFAQADSNKVAANKPPVIRICTPSRSSLMAPPLMVIMSHDKLIYKSLAGDMSKLSPDYIKSINILKDSLSTVKYGSAAKNGVIEIYLDDQKYPDAYKIFKTDSVENKKR
ncbi:MAG: hypothetical protein JWQ79_3872 [Mucilaginibacter sp.]|nr:hypothetical protein [Mucilaginibacter sp.]